MKKEIYSYNSEYLTCNGSPILPIMGEFHFSRYPEKEWRSQPLMSSGSIMRKRNENGIFPKGGT